MTDVDEAGQAIDGSQLKQFLPLEGFRDSGISGDRDITEQNCRNRVDGCHPKPGQLEKKIGRNQIQQGLYIFLTNKTVRKS